MASGQTDPGTVLPVVIEDFMRRASKEGGNLRLYTSTEFDAVILDFQDNTQLDLHHLVDEETFSDTGLISWALYDSIEPMTVGNNNPLPQPHIMIYNAMTPSSENERDFNEWYLREHIPLLSRAATWLSSRRYKLVESNFSTPSYLALHFWGEELAFNTLEYKTAIDTPWKWNVVNNVLDRRRYAFRFLSSPGIDYQ